MIKEQLLKSIEEAINSQPCGYCGGAHRITLCLRSSQNLTHSSAISSTDMVDTGFESLRPVVSYAFSDDACEPFQNAAKEFVARMIRRNM